MNHQSFNALAVKSKVRGMMLGFACGDALGAPGAGLPMASFQEQFGRIVRFTENKLHPYFSNLPKGAVTENTVLLLDAAKDYSLLGHFDKDVRRNTLVKWATRICSAGDYSRWPGTTTLIGARSLSRHRSPPTVAKNSVGAVYRCLPLAIVSSGPNLIEQVRSEVELTHLHRYTTVSGTILVLSIRNILDGYSSTEACKRALTLATDLFGCSHLTDLCWEALTRNSSAVELYKRFGTGARCDETVPLTLAIVAKFGSDFNGALESGANALKISGGHLWSKDCADENGGNSDGVAALVGALIGCEIGSSSIPGGWYSVENADQILCNADELSQRYAYSGSSPFSGHFEALPEGSSHLDRL